MSNGNLKQQGCLIEIVLFRVKLLVEILCNTVVFANFYRALASVYILPQRQNISMDVNMS